MQVLFDNFLPFSFAHGGVQVQITQTREALRKIGVEADYLRWYDSEQSGDVLHFFGRIPPPTLKLAHQKGMKVVISDLLGGLGARSNGKLWLQRLALRTLQKSLPSDRLKAFGWESYQIADACIAVTPWEGHLMSYIFGTPPEKVHVVPNGVEDAFLNSPRMERGPWLVCVGTIAPVKRILELAEAALLAQTPIWMVGKAYADSDPYAQRFFTLARENPKIIRHEGAIEERSRIVEIYRQARGFVLLSHWESLSLSALEAAACECPLLLSDLPWARTTFKENASYCPNSSPAHTAPFLRRFYDDAPSLKLPPKPQAWTGVAQELKTIYDLVLKNSP